MRWSGRNPFLLAPLGATLYNLVALREQLLPLTPVNDSAVHQAVARWAAARLAAGSLPFDGWFPSLGLGIALTHHYQALPDLLTGFIGLLVGVRSAYEVMLYLLLCSWPLSVYIGTRLLGWRAPVAAAAAALSPLIVSNTGYGFEHSSYAWQGLGLYTQLWAMALILPACGLAWRALESGRGLWAAALALGALMVFHFLTAYLALLWVASFVLVRPSELRMRALRAALIAAGALALAAFVLVPVLADGRFTLISIYNQGTFWIDSFGVPKVLSWLAGGRVLDNGRLPVLTVGAAFGLSETARLARREPGARALLVLLAGSLVLYSGPASFGWLLRLPGGEDLLFHRFVSGVQLACLLLAAVGVAWAAEYAVALLATARVPRLAAVAAAVAAVCLLLAPAAKQVADADAIGARASFQAGQESGRGEALAALTTAARSLGGGRVYAGHPADGGAGLHVGFAPAYIELLNQSADLVGFNLRVPSLPADAEARFDASDPAQYGLFGIRYVIQPGSLAPPPGGRLDAREGDLSLWELPRAGYFEVASASGPALRADRVTLGRVDGTVLAARHYASGTYQYLAYPGGPAPGPELGGRGTVERDASNPAGGVYAATVDAAGPALVVVKASFDPGWVATVDGKPAPVRLVAPGYPAVVVGAGHHSVELRYRGLPWLGALALLGPAALLALAWLEKKVTPTDRLSGSGTGVTTSSGSVARVPRGRGKR